MRTNEFSLSELSNKISAIAVDVRRAIKEQNGDDIETALVEDSIRQVIANKLDRLDEGLLEMFTSPSHVEFHEMTAIIERHGVLKEAEAVHEAVYLAKEFGDESVFDGFRPFSGPKLAAMMEYLAGKGHYVYRTSLNKLLFYSDLSYYYLRSHGISGAVYHNRPYGPVADAAAPILSELVREERIKVVPRTQTLEAEVSPTDVLTDDERRLLDWVAETYGEMTASQISDLSHREMAYKNTEPNEPIAYAYAQFLKHLPPKNLLDQ